MNTLRAQIDVPTAHLRVLLQMTDAVSQEDVITVASRAAGNVTREHIYHLADVRHRNVGGAGLVNKGLNFYEDAADAVKISEVGTEVGVRVDKAGFAQRLYGGKIAAVNYPYLWIPVDEESEGRSAGEFRGELYPIYNTLTGKGVGVRMSDDKVLFALREEVYQEPDPSVLPTDEQYMEAVQAGLEELMDARIGEAAAGLDGMEVTQ